MLLRWLMSRPVWQWRPVGIENRFQCKPLHTSSVIIRYIRLLHSLHFLYVQRFFSVFHFVTYQLPFQQCISLAVISLPTAPHSVTDIIRIIAFLQTTVIGFHTTTPRPFDHSYLFPFLLNIPFRSGKSLQFHSCARHHCTRRL